MDTFAKFPTKIECTIVWHAIFDFMICNVSDGGVGWEKYQWSCLSPIFLFWPINQTCSTTILDFSSQTRKLLSFKISVYPRCTTTTEYIHKLDGVGVLLLPQPNLNHWRIRLQVFIQIYSGIHKIFIMFHRIYHRLNEPMIQYLCHSCLFLTHEIQQSTFDSTTKQFSDVTTEKQIQG